MSLKGCSRSALCACKLSICILLHLLLVLSRFSPYLPVYCIFRCYILLLHHSLHVPISRHFGSFLFFLFSSDDHISIRLGHLLSPMCNRFPYRFNMLFFILSRIFLFLFVSNYSISYSTFFMFLQFFPKRSFLYLTAFLLICNPQSKFNSRSLKCFP